MKDIPAICVILTDVPRSRVHSLHKDNRGKFNHSAKAGNLVCMKLTVEIDDRQRQVFLMEEGKPWSQMLGLFHFKYNL